MCLIASCALAVFFPSTTTVPPPPPPVTLAPYLNISKKNITLKTMDLKFLFDLIYKSTLLN